MTAKNVCFVDTETTGLHPTRHEIWEVGLITPEGEHQWLLRVEHLDDADPIALDIGGFHQRHPAGNDNHGMAELCERADFADEFREWTHGLHLAGAVVSFDAERLATLLRRQGRTPSWHYHLIDVEALVAGYLAGRERVGGESAVEVAKPPWDSEAISRAVGVDPDDFSRHTALGDALWAKAMYEAVMSHG